MIACGAVSTGAATAAVSDLLPLIATNAYGFSKQGFSRLLAARSAGTAGFVLALAGVSKRLGAHWAATAMMVLAAPLLIGVGTVPAPVFAVGAVVMSGLLSNCYVQLNALCQKAHPQRQSAVNAMYRGLGQASAIVLPYVSTHFLAPETDADVAGPVLGFRIVGLGVAAAAVAFASALAPGAHEWSPPEGASGKEGTPASVGPLGALMPLWHERKVLAFIVTITSLSALGEAVSAFAAIRLTRPDELGVSTQVYGTACSISAVTSLAAVLLLGWCLDRVVSVKTSLVLQFALKSTAMAAMAVASAPLPFAASLVLFRTMANSSAAPMSMWIGRGHARRLGRLGVPLSSSFAAMKLASAVTKGLATSALSVLVARHAVVILLAGCAVATVPLLVVLCCLPQPPEAPLSAGADRQAKQEGKAQ